MNIYGAILIVLSFAGGWFAHDQYSRKLISQNQTVSIHEDSFIELSDIPASNYRDTAFFPQPSNLSENEGGQASNVIEKNKSAEPIHRYGSSLSEPVSSSNIGESLNLENFDTEYIEPHSEENRNLNLSSDSYSPDTPPEYGNMTPEVEGTNYRYRPIFSYDMETSANGLNYGLPLDEFGNSIMGVASSYISYEPKIQVMPHELMLLESNPPRALTKEEQEYSGSSVYELLIE